MLIGIPPSTAAPALLFVKLILSSTFPSPTILGVTSKLKLSSNLLSPLEFKNATELMLYYDSSTPYEVFKTHGKNNKILKTVKFKKFSEFYKGCKDTI